MPLLAAVGPIPRRQSAFKTRPVCTQSLIHLGGVFGSVQNPQCFVNVLVVVKYRQELREERWKKHSVHINYDFQLCKAERRDRRWVVFIFFYFFHMCSRFPGRRTMTHWLQPLYLCLDSNQRSHPPEREAATASPYLLSHRHSHQLEQPPRHERKNTRGHRPPGMPFSSHSGCLRNCAE